MAATSRSTEQVEQFAAKLYSGDKDATAEFVEKGWRGLGRDLGLPTLTAVLGQSQSTLAILFCCRVLTECLEQLLHTTEELAGFLAALVGVTAQRHGEVSSSATEAMCCVASTAMKRSYRHTPAVREMVGQLVAAAAGAGTTMESMHQTAVACLVLGALVEAMGERRFSHVAEDGSVARYFRDTDLLRIFVAAATFVKKQRVQWGKPSAAAAALRTALQLLDKTLSYNFTCTTCADQPDTGKVVGPFPPSWNAALTDRALFDRLWTLFKAPIPPSISPPPETASLPPYHVILNVLGTFVGLKVDNFVLPEVNPAICVGARRQWLDLVLLQTHVVMERDIHHHSEDVLFGFVRILVSVKQSYSIDELLSSDHFGSWVASLHRCTTQWFSASVTADTAVMTQVVVALLSLWARLCGAAMSYATADTSFLGAYGQQVLEVYLRCCVQGRGAWYAQREAEAGETAFSATSYPLEDDACGVEEELRHAVELASCACEVGNGGDGGKWRLLGEFINAQLNRFQQATGEHDGFGSVAAVEGAAWVLHLSAVCITGGSAGATAVAARGDLSSNGNAGANMLGSLLVEAFLLLDHSLRTSMLDSFPSVAVRSHFEEAAVAFLRASAMRLVVQRGLGGSEALARLVRDRLVQSRLMETEADLAAYLLDVVAHKVWAVLSAPNVKDATRTRALDLLETVTESPAAVRVLRNTSAHRRWFASLVPAAMPASLTLLQSGVYSAEQAHARYQYVRCVARVSLSTTPTTDTTAQSLEVADLLRSVVRVLQQTPDVVSDAALMGAIVDLRGVLSCATRRPYQVILGAVQPLVARLLQVTLTPVAIGSPLPVHVLRLAEELANNRGQRIFAGANSTTPYTLFRHLASCVALATPIVSQAWQTASAAAASSPEGGGPSDSEEWGWTCFELLLRMTRNALHGGYCNLGVFQLYNDDALESLVLRALELLASRPYAELAARPSTLEAAISYINELCDEFFTWVWLRGTAAEVRLMEGLVEATAFPADVSTLTLQAVALGALDRLVDCCCVNAETTTSTTAKGQELSQCLLAADAVVFKRLLSTCLEWAMAPRSAGTSETRVGAGSASSDSNQPALLNVLCGLLQLIVLRDESGLSDVREFFASRCQSDLASEAVGLAFEEAHRVFHSLVAAATTSAAASRTRKEAATTLVSVLAKHF